VRHENIAAEKKNFEFLQTTFRKMKGLNNDMLPDFIRLQRQIVAYLHTPSYVNYYKCHDKKLTKNTVKRCFVEPFCDKFLKINSVSVAAGAQGNPMMSEIARFKDNHSVFETLSQTLCDLDQHKLLSEALMFDVKPSLKDFIELLEVLSKNP
jgi:hypothetical protein